MDDSATNTTSLPPSQQEQANKNDTECTTNTSMSRSGTVVNRYRPRLSDLRSFTILSGLNENNSQINQQNETLPPARRISPCNPRELRRQPSRVALAAAGLGGLRESLFSVVLNTGGGGGSAAPEIEFTLPPSCSVGTPPFTRRSPAAELGGSLPDVSTSRPSSRATSPVPGGSTTPRAGGASPSSGGSDLRVSSGGFPLGTLNPALYKRAPSEDRGDSQRGLVCFSLSYEETEERLHIILRRTIGLQYLLDSPENAEGCLPVARLCLLPDERRYLQTRLRKRSTNPQFNEEFCFHVAARTLPERSLRIALFDLERRQKQSTLGQVTLPLKGLQLSIQQREFQLEIVTPGEAREACPGPCLGPCTRGPREAGITLLIALSFSHALERLTVNVLEARLAQTCSHDGCDLYGRASLVQQARAVKSKRTATVKRVSAPGTARFNESFSFHVAPAALDMCSLAVHVVRPGVGLAKDHSVGRVVLGSHMFARGSGLEHWRRMLATPTDRIQQWHCLMRDPSDP